jgi:hypothetical protein
MTGRVRQQSYAFLLTVINVALGTVRLHGCRCRSFSAAGRGTGALPLVSLVTRMAGD